MNGCITTRSENTTYRRGGDVKPEPTPFEQMRAIFESWIAPHVPTLARNVDLDGWTMRYRNPQVEQAWRAFHAGAAALACLPREQRDAIIAEAEQQLATARECRPDLFADEDELTD